MRTIGVCGKCLSEKAHLPQFLTAELDDSGVAYFTCPEGHRGATVVQLLKLEMLFQSGCMALVEGFTMEAVAALAASLERTFELYIRVICRKQGLQTNSIDDLWSQVGKQSERQLGAFHVLYALENETGFKYPNSRAAFRNKVIHQGYIPSSEKTLKYAEWVRGRIAHLLGNLKETASSELEALRLEEHAKKIHGLKPVDWHPTVIGTQTLLDPSDERPLGESLAELGQLMKSIQKNHFHVSHLPQSREDAPV